MKIHTSIDIGGNVKTTLIFSELKLVQSIIYKTGAVTTGKVLVHKLT